MAFATGRHVCDRDVRAPFDGEPVAQLVRKLYADHVVFHDGDDEFAPGIALALVPRPHRRAAGRCAAKPRAAPWCWPATPRTFTPTSRARSAFPIFVDEAAYARGAGARSGARRRLARPRDPRPRSAGAAVLPVAKTTSRALTSPRCIADREDGNDHCRLPRPRAHGRADGGEPRRRMSTGCWCTTSRPRRSKRWSPRAPRPPARPRRSARRCEIVFLSLPTPPIVREAVAEVVAGGSPRIVCDLSTSGPKLAQRAARSAHAARHRQLRCAGFRRHPRRRAWHAGDHGRRARGALAEASSRSSQRIGKPFYMGETPGAGQVAKLANNLLSLAAIATTAEAMTLGDQGRARPGADDRGAQRRHRRQLRHPRQVAARGAAAHVRLRLLRPAQPQGHPPRARRGAGDGRAAADRRAPRRAARPHAGDLRRRRRLHRDGRRSSKPTPGSIRSARAQAAAAFGGVSKALALGPVLVPFFSA